MAAISDCPEEPELLAVARGKADGDAIERHIDNCEVCSGRMDRLRAELSALGRDVAEVMAWSDPPGRDGGPSGGWAGEGSGRIVGRYELLEELGRGRQGVVYRARELGLAGHEVAVKILSPRPTDGAEAATRFVREIRYLADFHHPQIVPYHDSGDDRGQLYCAMRLMRSGALSKQPGPMDPMAAARLLIRIAEAVDYLHSRTWPIVHRDLNPKNILLDERGEPHVADFGLAVLLDGEGPAPQACGTIPYIAPEQIDPRFGNFGPASDLYSLGVILYEMLAGRTPFPGMPKSILGTLEREPVPPGCLRAGIPVALERICLKCLRRSTRDRYRTARELLEDLRAFEERMPLPHTPPEGRPRRLLDGARRRPALAVRLAVIVACSAIMWGYRIATGDFATLLPSHWARLIERSGVLGGSISIEAALVWLNQAIFVAWALASWAFQRRLDARPDRGGLEFAWRFVDVVALTLLIELDDALMSPLTVAFAVLIVVSAFRAEPGPILQTTLLSMLSYGLLVLGFHAFHPPGDDRPWRHFHYLVGLAAIGWMLALQADRTRALARIRWDHDRKSGAGA